MNVDYDIVIVGGGLVGMSLAIALEQSDWRVLQIEAQVQANPVESWDERHFALGNATIEKLEDLQVWTSELGQAAIRSVHVSRSGGFGRALFCAEAMGLPGFGATVPARLLVAALEQRLSQCRRVERLRPARLAQASDAGDHVALVLTKEAGTRHVRCRLLIAADGTDSPIREQWSIPVQREDYAQTALVCAAETAEPHRGRAFERFTADGPFALLPLSANRLGVVCTLPADEAVDALQFDDHQFIALLQDRFGYRLGKFLRVGRRQAWPLRLVVAEQIADRRMVLVGNAAQTIHPIGAQGFNLGLRDAGALADVLRRVRDDPGARDVLHTYASARAEDREQTIRFSDALVRATASRGLLPGLLQGTSMALIDRLPMVNRSLAYSAMGYRRRMP